MNATTATETPASKTRSEILRDLRNRVRTNVRVDGVYLTYRSRYEGSLKDVEKLIKALGGHIEEKGKSGKVRYLEGHQTTLPYYITFSVGIDEDLYLERGVRV